MPQKSRIFSYSGSKKLPSNLSPDLASQSDSDSNEVQSGLSLSPKMSRMSLSSLRSKSDLSTLRSIIPRRHPSVQDVLSPSIAPLEGFDSHEPNGGKNPHSPKSSPQSPAALQADNDPPVTKPKSKSKSKFKRKTSSQKIPVKELAALEGEDIASRLKLGTASIDGQFQRIEYGQFKQRPACLITVDLRLIYQPESTINKVLIDFRFGPLNEELDDKALHTDQSPISKVLAPVELEGMADRSKDTQHTKWEPEFSAFSVTGKVGGSGGHKTVNAKHRWRVQGQTEEHNDIYDTFRWRIMENTVSEDSVPRHVRLGMIVFHQHERFAVETTIVGGLRGSMRGKGGIPSKSIKEKRWFDPPSLDQVGEQRLHERMLQNHVDNYNLQIVNVESDRKLERQLTTLIDFTAMNGNDEDGGGMITGPAEQDLMSTLANDGGLRADSYD